MNKETILPFLENRYYLSGRILLSYLLDEFAIDAPFSFKVQNMAYSSLIEISDKEQDKSPHAILYYGNNLENSLYIYSLEYDKEITHIEYNEKIILEKAEFLENEVHFFSKKEDFISDLISINTALHKEILRQDTNQGHFIFIRLDLQEKILEDSKYLLELTKNSSPKISSAKIYCNKKDIGTIYFSWRDYD